MPPSLSTQDRSKFLGTNSNANEEENASKGVGNLEYWIEVGELFIWGIDVGEIRDDPNDREEQDEDKKAKCHWDNLLDDDHSAIDGCCTVADNNTYHQQGKLESKMFK